MILDFYKPENKLSHYWLHKLQNLLESEQFLKGLGSHHPTKNITPPFLTISDLKLAVRMNGSQEIWDMPEPWPFQYFAGELEFAEQKLTRSYFDNSQKILALEEKISNYDLEGEFSQSLITHIETVFQKQKVEESIRLHGNTAALSEKMFQFYTNNSLHDIVLVNFDFLIKACYFGGLERSDFFLRMYEGFKVGGLPCGWQGGIGQENGGKAVDCMTMLYLKKN